MQFQLFQQQLTDLNTDEISLALVLFLIFYFSQNMETPQKQSLLPKASMKNP